MLPPNIIGWEGALVEHEVCVGGLTALSCWREARVRVAAANAPSLYDLNPRPLLVRMLFDGTDDLDLSARPAATELTGAPKALCASDAKNLLCLLPTAERPLRCYVGEDAGRGCAAGIRASILRGVFPEGSFLSDPRGFVVPSPELLLLLLGRILTPGLLLMVASELCGFYALASDGALVAAPPVTSAAQIAECFERLAAFRAEAGLRVPRGAAAAASVCARGLDGAASPAEAALAYLLCLPRELGGYGLPAPHLNERIKVGGEPYVCDLSWNNGACLLEYQGGTHAGAGRGAADMRKGNALRASGRTLVEAGRGDLMSISGMDRLAALLADALGCEVAPWTSEDRAMQIKLRAELFSMFRM